MLINFTSRAFTCITLGASLISAQTVRKVKVGDSICVSGYVMDHYCIDRGTLFDNPGIDTLGPQGPIVHSVHCLIDVPKCVNSPFEILQPQADGSYGRAWRVESNDKLIADAKERGVCTNGCTGDIKGGLTATFQAEVLNLGSSQRPALLKVTSVNSNNPGCGDFVYQPPRIILKSGSATRKHIVHGSLMIASWGFLLPTGAIFAKFFRHRPDAYWFKIHKFCQFFGLAIAIISFIIILTSSDAINDAGSKTHKQNYNHAVLGITVMVFGLLQPLNAFIRPHAPENGEAKTTLRLVWEIVHKLFGYSALLLAIATIGIGTTLLPQKETQRNFQICYGALVGGLLLIMIIFTITDKKKYSEVPKNEPNEDKVDAEEGEDAEKEE